MLKKFSAAFLIALFLIAVWQVPLWQVSRRLFGPFLSPDRKAAEGHVISKKKEIYSMELVTKELTVDHSGSHLELIAASENFQIFREKDREVLWLRGLSVSALDSGGKISLTERDLYHSVLDIDLAAHRNLFGWEKAGMHRLFAFSQGMKALEFPAGFGIPVMSNETMTFHTTASFASKDHSALPVQHKLTLDFIPDKQLETPLKPLFVASAIGVKLLSGPDGFFGVPAGGNSVIERARSLEGQKAFQDSKYIFQDAFGRIFTAYWLLNPGSEENHTLATRMLNLPFDTTLHFATVHLHRLGQSLELRNLTTGQTVFRSVRRQGPQAPDFAPMEIFSSQEGIPLYRDHEYEIISIYENPTSENDIGMATVFLYLFDKEFKKPRP